MRWLVTGAGGMLARDCVEALSAAGHTVVALSRTELDITVPEAVTKAVAGCDAVLNCAGWTAVDDAEAAEGAAFQVNAVGPALLARAATRSGALVVQPSTDYVFEGVSPTPYEAGDAVNPMSAYGRTKAAGEWAVRAEAPANHLVVRTAWLYGAGGSCFPRAIAALARQRDGVSVVDDQFGQPTWTRDVAGFILRLVEARPPAGTYHATASGWASWFDFATEVCRAAGLRPGVVSRTTTAEFPRPAPRPTYSVLGHAAAERVGVASIPDWRERWAAAAGEVLPD